MSLPAHTNAVGSFDLHETGWDRTSGRDRDREINDYITYSGMLKARSYKSGTNSGKRPGDPWKYPTKYERVVSRILEDSSTSVTVSGETRHVVYTRSGQHLSLPFQPYESREIGHVLNNAENKSVNEALLALRGERHNRDSGEDERVRLQLGADIAEARKTADMIADTTKNVLFAYRAVKHGNFALAARHLGVSPDGIAAGTAPAKAWLGYQYGWKPLMGSIYDLNSRLNDSLRDKLHIFSATSFGSDSFQEEQKYPHLYKTHHEAIFTYQCKVKTELFYTIKSSVVDQIDSFGLLNPLSIAWELVPLSFVADWFVPVGNTLAALSASAGLKFHSGYQSVVEKRSLSSHLVLNDDAGEDDSLTSGGNYRWESFRFNRTPFGEFPLPRLYTQKNPFSTSHVISAIALIRQLL